MYVTKPLSLLKKFPSELTSPPPEGPNSGILIIHDEHLEPSCFFEFCRNQRVFSLPFPQNRKLELSYATGFFPNRELHFHTVAFIPVLNQPLSSNQYYAIRPHGKDRGEAFTNSKEEDMSTLCCCNYAEDEQPRPLNPHDKFQQFEIRRYLTGFVAKSVDPRGCPPKFLRKKGWRLDGSSSHNFDLGEALGLDTAARSRLPEFNLPLDYKNSEPAVVGKWYCPFVFVKEGTPKTLKDELNTTMFYEMTLQQYWERIFSTENHQITSNSTAVDVDIQIQRQAATVAGREAVIDDRNLAADGFLWFRSYSNVDEETSVGLSSAVIERIRWEEARVGWVEKAEKQDWIKRREEFGGVGDWNEYGCYVLVERFVLKRRDGRLLLTYDFRHAHQIRSKWE